MMHGTISEIVWRDHGKPRKVSGSLVDMLDGTGYCRVNNKTKDLF
jgi:hypothetical protein